MEMDFEPTNSFCYRFARYLALPEILKEPEASSGEPFRLIDVARRVIDRHLTADQLAQTFIRKEVGAPAAIGHTIRFYIPFLAKSLGQLTRVGRGIYSLPSEDQVSEDALNAAELDDDISSADVGESDARAGSVYAYTFPLIRKSEGPFPIKIGRASGDVQARVASQTKWTAAFERAEVLAVWPTKRVAAMEQAIHNILRVRGKWREDAPGTEWFNTTLAEVEDIVRFIEGE